MHDKTALITGASSGIGRALALRLAQDGYRLALIARRQQALDKVARAAHGAQVKTYVCDVQRRERVRQVAERVLSDFGAVDLAVLNAGVAGNMAVTSFDATAVETIFNTNVLGVVYWVESLLPAMLERRSGTLLGVSSLAGHRGLPTAAAYSASKAALSAFLESLRVDLKPHGLRVVTVEPGYVRTPMTARHRSMPFLVEVDEAANLILRQLNKGKTMIRFPWQMALLLRVLRSLPIPLYDRVAALMVRRS